MVLKIIYVHITEREREREREREIKCHIKNLKMVKHSFTDCNCKSLVTKVK